MIRLRHLIAFAIVILILYASGFLGVYAGRNAGIYLGPCGVEVAGTPGLFCGAD